MATLGGNPIGMLNHGCRVDTKASCQFIDRGARQASLLYLLDLIWGQTMLLLPNPRRFWRAICFSRVTNLLVRAPEPPVQLLKTVKLLMVRLSSGYLHPS
jgi:hypothetical protein